MVSDHHNHQTNEPQAINPKTIHIDPATSTPTAALIGGAAVVVAGVIERVPLDADVVLEAGICVDVDVVVLDSIAWDVDVDDDCDGSDGEVEPEEVVMVVSVVCVVPVVCIAEEAEDTADEDMELTAEEATEDAAEDTEAMEVDIELTAEEATEPTSVEEEAADNEIKLPPLLNSVTVDSPLTTTVEAVTVLCAPLPLATVVCALIVVGSGVNENEYVVFGIKLEGNVAKADESTDNALVVSGAASVDGKVVMVVNCVVAVVWMGMITAKVREGGIETVAVAKSQSNHRA
ncbi:hypothetical protein M436DRAFT_85167 [Aureobasidium namibiae CBS 147.97]|uniref:Uncharacterized protein n=1 Tax=Aureobasidium namibiae CBS 147.97 TaxID=1043004 RepID=A0A074X543_9PEZI|nr:uncharacterized protein M436DRAFT_85167 [Aureobasidium namibiae CBS 147.97]KEQ69696.1 hypothetical protein M436DRAFT_85167 [Aureobasidium namibiae CBS 147.97]